MPEQNLIDSFVYCWTDHLYNKLYVGSRKGHTEDGYICSSTLMLEQYHKRPNDFTRQIIALGLYEDIRKLEEVLLKTIDAAKDKTFYNQSNCSSKFYLKDHTEESRNKISIGKTGLKRPDLSERNRLGLTEKHRKSISVNHADVSGNKNPIFGKKHSNETRLKMKLNSKDKNLCSTKSEETKSKMSIARKKYWENRRNA